MSTQVSVLVPVYNAARFLRSTLESVLDQTFREFEIVAVDDGSLDESAAILERYRRKDSRLRIFSQPNGGQGKALNRALSEARGTLLARIDADDLATPDRIATQVALFDSAPDIVAAGSHVRIIDPDGWTMGVEYKATDHHAIDDQLLRGFGGAICAPVSMLRRDAVERVGGFNDAVPSVEDLDLCLKLAEIGRLANQDLILGSYRKHLAATNFASRARMVALAREVVAAAAERRRCELPPFGLDDYSPQSDVGYHREWAEAALRSNQRATSLKHATLALVKSGFGRDEARFLKYIGAGLLKTAGG